ncbi:tRNA (adenine(22)-N(1))-methyltransferase [Levilactobacillus parabrevis]|uniref:SAM-dependent methyltransferase n=1 Tax=Levilactobacillus parabrevis ATCC 53295 TaxID=1267003 RepID=A0A0R1H7N6_9LACO|nr:tRNA (adenine(22)-N(1))-methyltransferase TrmK [Levilactobacillus parabrevis]KRK38887.1 SAM-dependent methyltransferase [Levilactobacillus parabrevis ATCC 53295]MCT4488729.1 tRNA (adenine(22)-N(1))-methyltransferase TrmK [Levilactobacillus parabrevis]
MDADHLSVRLATVADYVPMGSRLADIGTDHAYLPVNLAKRGKIAGGVAGEVVKGPFENAQHEINKEGLSDRITARLANGLQAIEADDHIDTVAIAGMGGTLIAQILTQDFDRLAGVNRLVLQPNVGEKNVRQFLMTHGFQLITEKIVTEDGHDYEILVADRADDPQQYNAEELRFGPYLLAEHNAIFMAKWRRELARTKQVLAQVQSAKEVPAAKVAELTAEIKEIEEVLQRVGA